MSEYVEFQTTRPYVCELCDTNKHVEWRCVECAQNLCNSCKRSHLRSNASSGHYVVTLFEGLLHSKYAVDITCLDHNPEKLATYCVTCDVPVCAKCMVSSHVRHYFMDITEKSEEISCDFTEKLKTEKTIATEVQQRASETLLHVKNYCCGIRSLEASVNENADRLKSTIDAIRNAVLQEIRNCEIRETEPLVIYANELKTQSRGLIQCLNQFEKRRRFNKGAALIKLFREAQDFIPSVSVPPSTPELQLPEFVVQQLDISELKDLFGVIQYPSKKQMPCDSSEKDGDVTSASDAGQQADDTKISD